MFYDFCYVLFNWIFKIWLRLEIHGRENIPQAGPVVLAANHLSLLDPPVLGAASNRKAHFMAKSELFKPAFFGWIIKNLGVFPVHRGAADRAAIKTGLAFLEQGQVVSVFPEGTRSKTGQLGEAGAGAFMLAAKTKAEIVPALIFGTDLKRHAGWPKVYVLFGKPLVYDKNQSVNKEHLALITEAWTQAMQELVQELEQRRSGK